MNINGPMGWSRRLFLIDRPLEIIFLNPTSGKPRTAGSPLKGMDIDKKALPRYERKDLRHGIPADQRPSKDEYDRYVYLVDLFRRLNYNEQKNYTNCPFLVQDLLFKAILCRANRDLNEIAKILEDTVETDEWIDLSSRAISKDLWCQGCKKFESFDMKQDNRKKPYGKAG